MAHQATRIGIPYWVASVNQASAVSNATLTATAGIALKDGYRHEITHLAVTKTGTATLKIWGYTNLSSSIGKWLHVDTVAFNETTDECIALRGLASFSRLQTSINAISTGNLNTYWGFCE